MSYALFFVGGIKMTEHLQKQINDLLCNHPKKEIRFRLASNNVKMFTTQCIRCGEIIGQWIPHGEVENPETIMPIDELLREYYNENYRDLKNALEDRIEKSGDPETIEHGDWYAEYLKSPEWQLKRALVLDRCNSVCEGCMRERATIAHHTTYKNIGAEFLFELVGVCRGCHDRLHPRGDIDD
jgi:hypothetical protein